MFWVCSHWTKYQLLLPWVSLISPVFVLVTTKYQCCWFEQKSISPYIFDCKNVSIEIWLEHQHFTSEMLLWRKNKKTKHTATMVALFICGLGPTLLTMGVWIDDRHWPFFLLQVHGDLASLFSLSSVPLSFVGSVLCGCSGCERVLPESVTGMLATSSPGYIKPYWCASKMLPKLADDADAAKTVGGDRCYLSSPAPSSQIVPCNKAINLMDQHINFIATFTLQLGRGFTV